MYGQKIILTLFVLSISYPANLVDATKLTYSNKGGKIYVETDSKHFAMYGYVKDVDEVGIVGVNRDKHSYLTPKCFTRREKLNDVDEKSLRGYARIRNVSLAVGGESPAMSHTKNTDYTWSQTFSDGEKGFSAIRLDKNTVVYSSEYFPSLLARVIISGKVVIFVHHDGNVTMKWMQCLYPSERNLVAGIRKINTSSGISSRFSSKDDNALKKHLKSHPIEVEQFIREQKYQAPLTGSDLSDG